MAGKDKEIVKEEPIAPAVPETPETATTEEAVVKNAKEAGDKLVNVKAIANHECYIGSAKVSIKKGSDYKLPDNIATILSNAGYVLRK